MNCRCRKMPIIWPCDQMSVIICRMTIRRCIISQEFSLIPPFTLNMVPVIKQNFPLLLVCKNSRSYQSSRRALAVFVARWY